MASIITVDILTKPSKDNIEEPILSPMRKDTTGENGLRKLISWRLHRRHFKMRADWIVWVEEINLWVKIPAGFVFDGASVPKSLNSIINAVDAIFYGSILHDFIYRTNQLIVCKDEEYGNWYIYENVTKKVADKILFKFSNQMEGTTIPGSIAYGILCAWGWIAWNKSRKRGYHLLTTYPSETNSVLNYYS